MKKFILAISLLLMSGNAVADGNVECELGRGKSITLDILEDYYLMDPSISSLKRHKAIQAIAETRDSVEFLVDFGSDYEKKSYVFTGMKKCGLYDSDAKIVTLTTSLRAFNGRTRQQAIYKCSCIED